MSVFVHFSVYANIIKCMCGRTTFCIKYIQILIRSRCQFVSQTQPQDGKKSTKQICLVFFICQRKMHSLQFVKHLLCILRLYECLWGVKLSLQGEKLLGSEAPNDFSDALKNQLEYLPKWIMATNDGIILLWVNSSILSLVNCENTFLLKENGASSYGKGLQFGINPNSYINGMPLFNGSSFEAES